MGETRLKPLRLSPVYVKSIWAGERLYNIRNLEEKGIGIAREVCAYKNSENIIAEGEYAGKSLKEIIQYHHQDLMGDDPSDQLLRAAYIDAIEDLSVQVHPNDAYAKTIGDYEKSESWYIVEAEEGAYITAGTTIHDKEVLRLAAEDGTLEQYIRKIPVKKGDFALIPAGLLHACGKDMLAIEMGSFGGITYRLYDYGRPRPLDLDRGFEVLDPNLSCSITHHPIPANRKDNVRVGVDHPLFHVDVIDIAAEMTLYGNGLYYVLVCVDGECVVYCEEDSFPLSYTQSLFIPASMNKVTIKGNVRLLKGCHPR